MQGVSLLGRKSSQKMEEASYTNPVLVVSLVKSVEDSSYCIKCGSRLRQCLVKHL
jgi:hypothetical protein